MAKDEPEDILKRLKEARDKDPQFDKKCIDAWIKAEAAADPDACDNLTASDLRELLDDTVAPKKPTSPKRSK